MDSASQYELYLIKKELQDIVNELLSIANGVKLDFSGVGNEKCAESLVRAANHYMDVRRQLDSMNLSELSDEFKAKKLAEEQREAAQKAAAQKNVSVSSPAPVAAPVSTPAKSSSKSKTSSSKKNKQSAVSSIVEEALAWLFR